MADLWNEFPADPGMLSSAVSQQLALNAPLLPVQVGPVMGDALDHPTARPMPYRDPVEWLLLKHLVQVALVGSVLLFVLHGGEAPMMALSYVGTALLLMGVIVLADRQRFSDRDPAFEFIEFIAPAPRPPEPAPAVRQGALVPLVEQMQEFFPERVSVT